MMCTGKAPGNDQDWKGSLEVTLCNHLLWQGLLEPLTQAHERSLSKYVQGRKLHSFSGQPVPVLCHPPDIQRQPSVFQFVPLAHSLVALSHHSLSFFSFVSSPFPGAQPVHLIDSLVEFLEYFLAFFCQMFSKCPFKDI